MHTSTFGMIVGLVIILGAGALSLAGVISIRTHAILIIVALVVQNIIYIFFIKRIM